uniref:Uncharacterized protein n=1 Tax=Anguilla anguilla TaxID=7936 RepID=A0A0E9PMK6_ANGAN
MTCISNKISMMKESRMILFFSYVSLYHSLHSVCEVSINLAFGICF